ncbi:MAG: C4-dicarboxylic acid transporter DauA [bacterium]|nr:C4-dicarboxylic acid transporter DauA [bacterium]
MPSRLRASLDGDQPPRPTTRPFAVGLRRALAAGYGAQDLRADLLAGSVVGIVAIPLSMALAIASGVPPQHGLYTAVVAGAVAALTGGSKFQVTGPTAAFVVVLAPIVGAHGLAGLLVAGLLAGLILVAMGVARLGRFVEFIPYPVTTGFTAGIATVIATLQLKDAFGLRVDRLPERFPEKVAALWQARGTWSAVELGVTLATLGLLLVAPRLVPRVPGPLVALALVGACVWALGVPVATIGSRFHGTIDGHPFVGIPPLPPLPHLPWGGDLSFDLVASLLPAAMAIAMLGAIESLLSAVVADGMTGKRHDPDAELVGQGLANVIAPFFGGIAATGALARTATNVRSGARSPVAALVHAAVVLGAILVLAPLVAHLPMGSLAALLLLVAWNMSDRQHVAHMLRVAPRSDVFVLVTCFALTVAFDMVMAVGVGVVLAAFLFMNRMAVLTRARILVDESPEAEDRALPPSIAVYEIAGPLFFGAAQKAVAALDAIGASAQVVVLGLGRVPVIDATGLVALESALARLTRERRLVIVAGPLPEPRRVFARAQWEAAHERVVFARDLPQALGMARDLVALNPDWVAAKPQQPAPSPRAS